MEAAVFFFLLFIFTIKENTIHLTRYYSVRNSRFASYVKIEMDAGVGVFVSCHCLLFCFIGLSNKYPVYNLCCCCSSVFQVIKSISYILDNSDFLSLLFY